MGKASAATKTTTIEHDTPKAMQTIDAQKQFLVATLDMSWRLALAFLLPLIAGIKLDDHFNSSPAYVIAGFIVGAMAGAVMVWRSVQEVNEAQAESNKKGDKTK